MGTLREVRKRDDRVVPFDSSKIADAICQALRSVGGGGHDDADELAGRVTALLQQRYPSRIPGIEEIQDCVEEILVQSGRADVAKAYILYRNKRARLREALEVRKTAGASALGGGDAMGGPQVEEPSREGLAKWAKSRITAALIREADVDPGVAAEIAAAVERKVLDSGIQRISTALVRELVDNELFERGYNASLQRQLPLGLPRFDLEELLFARDAKQGFQYPKTPIAVREFIAGRILGQYALQEVHSPEVADAHRDGRLHLHQLEDPLRFAELAWRLPFPLAAESRLRTRSTSRLESEIERALGSAAGKRRRRDTASSDGAARGGRSWPEVGNERASGEAFLDRHELFRRLGELGSFVHGELRLRGVERLLVDGRSASGQTTAVSEVGALLERLGEIQRSLPGAGLTLELGTREIDVPWLDALLERIESGATSPAVWLEWRPSEVVAGRARAALERAVELFARGAAIELVPDLDHVPLGARAAGKRDRRLNAVASKVTINLPQAAYRSAASGAGRIEEDLEATVLLAVKALVERREFLLRLGRNRESPLWDVLGCPQDVDGRPLLDSESLHNRLGIVGLNECVKFLTGFELHQDARAVRKATALLDVIEQKLRREQRGMGLVVAVEETPAGGVTERLEQLDRSVFPQFQEVERERASWGSAILGASYSGGVRIHPGAPIDPLRRLEHLASFLPRVRPCGVLGDSPELVGAEPELLLCLLEETASALARAPAAGA